jgi:hypothetical protein
VHTDTRPVICVQPRLRWTESPWIILPVMFIVVGPLALPMLWRSRAFTKPWKLVVTVLCLGYTAILLWYCGVVVREVVRSLGQLDDLQKLR